MIKCRELHTLETSILATYDQEVQAYNIITGIMSDSFRPYEVVPDHIMMWVNEEGFLGEVECLQPVLVTAPPCRMREEAVRREGFPQLEILARNRFYMVQHSEDGFVIWIDERREVDTVVVYKTMQFLLSGQEVVGIVAQQALPEQEAATRGLL